MKYILIIALLWGVWIPRVEAAKKAPAIVTAEIYGYQKDMVYFDFREKDGINMEFPYREGQRMEFMVNLDDITTMVLNTFIEVYLQPGDSVHVKVTYNGRNYDRVEFSGTPEAVAINSKVHETELLQRERRYKTNIPAMLVILVDAREFHKATLREWKDELAIIEQVKDQIHPRVYRMAISQIEGTLLNNLITYPYASSEMHRKKLEDCMADDYWTALDGYQLRDDEASLRSRAYMCMLSPYKEYMRMKAARAAGKEYKAPKSLEEQYRDIADFYNGSLRDAALFVFLYDSLAAGKDFNTLDKLVQNYFKKYNKEKEYKQILTQVMQ